MSLAPHSGSFRASQQSCSVTARDESPYVSIFTSLLKTQFTVQFTRLHVVYNLFDFSFSVGSTKGDVK